LATIVLVAVTLFGALPVYAYVAGRSPRGSGAIGLLERLIPGWFGKIVIVALLGFAATDFIFTRTLSAADAAVHLINNPMMGWRTTLAFLHRAGTAASSYLPPAIRDSVDQHWSEQLLVTVLLLLIGFLFWATFRRGFTGRIVHLAVAVCVTYLVLNAVVIGSGLRYLWTHPAILDRWYEQVISGDWGWSTGRLVPGGWLRIALICVLLLPKMALGLSGFELSMVVMPLIRRRPDDDPSQPCARIRDTRKMLAVAALLMSLYLLGSALVTTTLIPADAIDHGRALNRALAYLAHGELLATGANATELSPLFGEVFGSVYDVSTVLILSLAGASVTIGLRDLVPPYLHRLGMELPWAHAVGSILYVFNLIKLLVTLLFRADVMSQRGAYASSILVLLSGAAAAAALDRRQTRPGRLPWFFMAATATFSLTAAAVIISQPDGILLALACVVAVLVLSMASRLVRTNELRFAGFAWADDQSRFLWESMILAEFPVLVPHCPGHRSLAAKEALIRCRHRLTPDVPLVFIEAFLGDPSDFCQLPVMEVKQDTGRFALRITGCPSIPHVIAAVALELSRSGKPPEIHFGWSNEPPLRANLNFVLFGAGNIPWMVREILRKAEPDVQRQPRVVIG
jgi:hypothetical protein